MPARFNFLSEKGKPHGSITSTATPRQAESRRIVPRFPAISGSSKAMRMAVSHRSRAAMQRSEEHTSELQSLMRISYAVFCLKKKRIFDIDGRHLHRAIRAFHTRQQFHGRYRAEHVPSRLYG